MLTIKRFIFTSLAALGLVGLLAACGGGGGGDTLPVFDPSVAPKNVEVVSGDGYSSALGNTISWTRDPTATSYVVYWSTTPGVTVNSDVVVPAEKDLNYSVHSDIDVVAGATYYYRVQALSGGESSVLSEEVKGTPQASAVSSHLMDVAWNGYILDGSMITLVAVGESGVILNSPNGTVDGWSLVTHNLTNESLASVTWGNAQFLVVGAGGTVLTSVDGDIWESQNSGVSADLEGVVWTGSLYVVVGKRGIILTGSADGTGWTEQQSNLDTSITLEGVAANDSIIVAVGTNSTLLTSVNDGVDWTLVDLSAQGLTLATNNSLNDVTWDGTRFAVVGSDSTILSSTDGVSWTSYTPSISDYSFEGVVQWDSSLPNDPMLASVGASATFLVNSDSVSGYIVPTGTNQQLEAITWLDDGLSTPYFLMVGHDGTVLTNYQ
jgi:hypothetical protein